MLNDLFVLEGVGFVHVKKEKLQSIRAFRLLSSLNVSENG
jgi:hypothetical protein